MMPMPGVGGAAHAIGRGGCTPAALFFIFGWWILSNLFGQGGYHLNVPLLVTAFHATIHFSLSALVLIASGRLRPPAPCRRGRGDSERPTKYQPTPMVSDKPTFSSLAVSDDIEHGHGTGSSSTPAPTSEPNSRPTTPSHAPRPVTWPKLLARIVPCGMATALDIGLSNASLKSLSLSFYTLVKSSTPMFALAFALALRLEKPSLRLFGVMAAITLGMSLAVAHADESAFDWTGFTEALLASIMGGARMILIEVLLTSDDLKLDNPFATNMHLAPVMFLTLLPSSLMFEPLATLGDSPFFNTAAAAWHTFALMCGGGLLAFAMVCSEYRAIQLTSGLTISVAGICKEVLTIVVGIVAFGDVVTPLNVLGLAICLAGIGVYNYHKYVSGSGGDGTRHEYLLHSMGDGELTPAHLGRGGGQEDMDQEYDDRNVLFDATRTSTDGMQLLFLADSASEGEEDETADGGEMDLAGFGGQRSSAAPVSKGQLRSRSKSRSRSRGRSPTPRRPTGSGMGEPSDARMERRHSHVEVGDDAAPVEEEQGLV
ncbi:triose-phosphate transporter family-domain-containing protein [Catenaria anguillulae PL171]|uniref:Triose-phosphate transporter family-domain-containing protein n=1 Tax=Catenaria anguillulae PL171 TaxID=765915 RepID=A0A1Y2HJF6_9FUNG|nr:triose-phosphate transporter family-domain-containing protein [Catenaria anguillulae PL171]